MDSSEARLDGIETQRSMDAQQKSRYFPMNLIKRAGKGTTPPSEDTESVPEFFTNIKFSDFFSFPGVYVPMSPEILSAVSAGNEKCLEKLRRYGKPMACLKSDQGDSILHLAASRGHLEIVKNIVSECPCLLVELDSRDQLPLHVAAFAGHVAVVEALVATLTFVLAKLSEEERQRLNLYAAKDMNGDTPLHLALKGRRKALAACLVNANQRASFLANKDGISSLYMAVEAGFVSLVKAMLKTKENDGLDGRESNFDSHWEGRKCLVHAALKAWDREILHVILREYPSLMDERDKEGMTCLSYGASIGYLSGVRTLLSRSTRSVYVCNDDGSFPIHIAMENRHMGVLKEIIKHCPDSRELLNKQGQNILHIASKIGKPPFGLFRYLGSTPLIEKQDVDGNTPLHLATINWHPRTIWGLIFRSKMKGMDTRNNSGLTALDIAESNLQPNYIFMERVTLMVLLYLDAFSTYSPHLMLKKKITRRSDPPAGDKIKDYFSTLLVVAALIATVTFAAGFTIPGGFNSSGPNLGMATLASNYRLIYFMVFDILAMQSSIVTISTLIWAQLGDPALVHRSLNVALPSLCFALLCMPAAFYYGVSVAFAHVKGFVIFLSIIFTISIFLMIFVLGPHVILQIPGIPAVCGPYFVLFVMLVNENSYEKASAAEISGKDLMQKKKSSQKKAFCSSCDEAV